MKDGTFKIGEIVIFQNLPFPFDHLNNLETEVVGVLQQRYVFDIYGTKTKLTAYLVTFFNKEAACSPENLKRKATKPIPCRDLELVEV